jgi:hypothetical protein
MLTVMGIKARSLGFDLEGLSVSVLKIMKDNPRRVGGIELTFNVPASLVNTDPSTRELLKNIGHNCPVMKSIHPDINVKIDWGKWSG